MTRNPDRLYELLPTVLRQRDADRGEPLRALLQVIAEQVGVLEDDLTRQYANWFIETCDDWVVPYIGALIGYSAPPQAADAGRAALLASVLTPRRAVANTIRDRRRKGTLPLLELIAQDTAGWPARAVEFYRLLGWFQALNFPHPERGRTADLRDGPALAEIGGPFDGLARSADIRRIASSRTRGLHNIPNIGLHVWRLKPYLIERGPTSAREDVGMGCYTFSVLGNDMPLFTLPRPEARADTIAGRLNLPAAISSRIMARHLGDYYGPDRSLALWVEDWPARGQSGLVPAERIVIANLDRWHHRPPRDHVAIDPERGRFAFHPRQIPGGPVFARYVHAFSDDTGGGPYPQPRPTVADAVRYPVAAGTSIGAALARLRDDDPDAAIIEITETGVFTEPLNIALRAGQQLHLRARAGCVATLRLLDFGASVSDALRVSGEAGSSFALSGIIVAGRGLQVTGPMNALQIDHCTLVPGWQIGSDCTPRRPNEASLELVDCTATVTIRRSILGTIQISNDEVGTDPISLTLSDSILDATSDTREAICAPSWPHAHAALTILRTTVIGTIQTHAIQLAEDSIFTGRIQAARRQTGCIRFSHVPAGSRTPRRFRCQPDLAERAALDKLPVAEIGGATHVPMLVGGDASAIPDQIPDNANLRLRFQTSSPTPALGETFTLTLAIDNPGPRRATGISVALMPPARKDDPTNSPFGSGTHVTLSHGALAGGTGLSWRIPALNPGESALLTATVALDAEPEPPRMRAEITACSFTDDGQAYRDALLAAARAAMWPRFTDRHYGRPGYGQLHACTDPGILEGASDAAEMGAFHDLFQPQRHAALAARLDDNLPAGMAAGIIFVT